MSDIIFDFLGRAVIAIVIVFLAALVLIGADVSSRILFGLSTFSIDSVRASNDPEECPEWRVVGSRILHRCDDDQRKNTCYAFEDDNSSPFCLPKFWSEPTP